jgi:large subunit ribosomal protein L12
MIMEVYKMEMVYAALLLHSARKKIDEAGLKKVLEAAGGKPEAARVKAMVSSLEGVNIDEAIKQTAVAATAVPSAEPEKAEAKEEKKKEEKKEDEGKKQEEAAAGLSSLFG